MVQISGNNSLLANIFHLQLLLFFGLVISSCFLTSTAYNHNAPRSTPGTPTTTLPIHYKSSSSNNDDDNNN